MQTSSAWQVLTDMWTLKVKPKAKSLVYDTPIEIFLGAAIVGSTFFYHSFNANRAKEGEIPLAFSEIEHTTRVFEKKGQPVPPLTRFYSVANDVSMKVFESSNIALAKDRSHEAFARHLETRINESKKEHALISEYAQEFPESSNKALQSLKKISEAARDLPPVIDAFNRVWTYSSDDHYYTKHYTETVGTGENRRTVHRTKPVYDYTIHKYTFHPHEAENAARLLNEFVRNHPDVRIEEQLQYAAEIHEQNKGAILGSMKNLFKDRTPSAREILGLANIWATGCSLSAYHPALTSSHSSVVSLAPAWNAAKQTARSNSYRTESRSDSGPHEYQVVNKIKGSTEDVRDYAAKITGGIGMAGQDIPILNKKIKEYVDVTLNGFEGDPDKMRDEIMRMSRNIYSRNFGRGFDVQPFKWGNIIVLTLIGMTIGGGIGAGVNHGFNVQKEREIAERHRNTVKSWRGGPRY